MTSAVKESLTFHFVNEIDQVLDIVFGPDLRERARAKAAEVARTGSETACAGGGDHRRGQ